MNVLLNVDSLKDVDDENIKNIYNYIKGIKTSIPEMIIKSLDISNNYDKFVDKEVMNGSIVKIKNENFYLKNNFKDKEINTTSDDKNNLWKIVKLDDSIKPLPNKDNLKGTDRFTLVPLNDNTKYLTANRSEAYKLFIDNTPIKILGNFKLHFDTDITINNTKPNVVVKKDLTKNNIEYNNEYYLFHQGDSKYKQLLYRNDNNIKNDKLSLDNSGSIFYNDSDIDRKKWKWKFENILSNIKSIFNLLNIIQQHIVLIGNIDILMQLKDIPKEKQIKILQYQLGLVNNVVTNLPKLKEEIESIVNKTEQYDEDNIMSLLKFNLEKVSPLLTKYNKSKTNIQDNITLIKNSVMNQTTEEQKETSLENSNVYSSAASGSAGTGVISSAPKSDNIINVAYYNYNYNSRNRSETNSNSNDNSNDNTEDDNTDEVEDNDTDESSYRSISGVDGSLYTRNVNTDNAVYYNKILGEDFNACPVMASNPWGPFESGDFN